MNRCGDAPGAPRLGSTKKRWMHFGGGATGTLGLDEGRAAPSVGSVGRALFFGERGLAGSHHSLGGSR